MGKKRTRGNFVAITWTYLDRETLDWVTDLAKKRSISEGGAAVEAISYARSHGFGSESVEPAKADGSARPVFGERKKGKGNYDA